MSAALSVLPTIAWPQTIQDQQAALVAAASATDTSVTACASLDAQTKTGWSAFYAALTAFTQQPVSIWNFGLGSVLDQTQSYGAQLKDWQTLLGKKCSLGNPIFDPNPASENTPALLSIAQWAAYGVVAVAGAYVIGDLVSVLPIARRSADHAQSAAGEARRFARRVSRRKR